MAAWSFLVLRCFSTRPLTLSRRFMSSCRLSLQDLQSCIPPCNSSSSAASCLQSEQPVNGPTAGSCLPFWSNQSLTSLKTTRTSYLEHIQFSIGQGCLMRCNRTQRMAHAKFVGCCTCARRRRRRACRRRNLGSSPVRVAPARQSSAGPRTRPDVVSTLQCHSEGLFTTLWGHPCNPRGEGGGRRTRQLERFLVLVQLGLRVGLFGRSLALRAALRPVLQCSLLISDGCDLTGSNTPGGSACCYWNGCRGRCTTRAKSSPAALRTATRTRAGPETARK